MKLDLKKYNDAQAIIVHLTDTYFIQEVKVGSKTELPGFAKIGSLIKKVKSQNSKTLVLHSGDFLFPSFMSNFFHGKQMIEILNECGFNFITLGNHDFDGGPTVLKQRLSEAKFKTILTNLKTPKNFRVKCPSHVLWPENQPTTILLGLAGRSTQKAGIDSGFAVLDPYQSLQKKIKFIEKHHPEIKSLVVLSHMSNHEDKILHNWLSNNWNGISYIFGGHDHNSLVICKSKTPQSILVKSESNARNVRIYPIFSFDKINKIRNKQNLSKFLIKNLITLKTNDFSKLDSSKKIFKIIQKWEKQLFNVYPEKTKTIKKFRRGISFDATEFSLRYGTTNFGNFIADCLCKGTKSDIAFINSGHFRGDRKISNVIMTSDLRRIFVMDEVGSLVKIKLSAKECKLILKHGFKEPGKGRILQISRNTPQIIKKSKPKENLIVVLVGDMLLTDDDGFAEILAKHRKISIKQLRQNVKNFTINKTIIDLVKEQAKSVDYDSNQRFTIEDASKF